MGRILTRDDLYKRCGLEVFPFRTTEDLDSHDGIVGQQRALNAIDFGLDLRSGGFNIFVLGDSGTGKTSAIRAFISRKAEAETVPPDRAYVFNFREPDAPVAIALRPGQGLEFQRDVGELVAFLRAEIPKLFESKEYERQKDHIVERLQAKQKEMFASLSADAERSGFNIRSTGTGFSLVALNRSGEPFTEETFRALDEKERERLRETGKGIQEKLDDVLRSLKKEEKAVKEELRELQRTAVLSVLGHPVDELKAKYGDNPRVLDFLDAVREDILENVEDFKAAGDEGQNVPLPFLKASRPEPNFTKYSVNVIVNNGGQSGAPCVFESNPTYYNLFGRVEHKFQFGVAISDFTMIKAGSLQKANGGYLVINAMDLLKNLFSYDALKRAIRNREVKIEDVWEQYRLVTTAMLKPEPIPLDVKIILIGSPELYYLLYNLDEEYRELFKVKADFDNRMPRTEENIRRYSVFVATKVREENLLPFDPSGVARVVEAGSRLAEHQGKLSAKFSDVSNIIRESHYWARKEGAGVVAAWHVEKALDEKVYRHGMIAERIREMMHEGTLIVETSGERVGQVNGLAVLDLGDHSFGKPSRITTSVYAGKGGILNIERETKLSGKIHEKAVLILSSFIGRTYASRKPVSLTATIAFEQLYGLIEGDSATCAELYSLLSAISGAPIRQGIAVTGSMDQNGDVQPVGGVNEKIEGFFDLCRLRGVEGAHGVIIPAKNVVNLMLRDDVVEAVAEGKFRIHAIDRVEEGIEPLMGIPAGATGADGSYPEGSLNRLVTDRLKELSEAVRREEDAKSKRRKDES